MAVAMWKEAHAANKAEREEKSRILFATTPQRVQNNLKHIALEALMKHHTRFERISENAIVRQIPDRKRLLP